MLVGINFTNTFLLSSYHQVLNFSKRNNDDQEQKVSIQRFAGILASQLIQIASKRSSSNSKFLPEDNQVLAVSILQSVTDLLSPALSSSFTITAGKNVLCSETDANGLLHYLVKYDVTKDPSGWKRMKMKKCKICIEGGKHRDVGQYCATCGESYSLCNKC